jgi:hypothetical protein
MPFIPVYRHSTDPENFEQANDDPTYMRYLLALDLRENMWALCQNYLNEHLNDNMGPEARVRCYESAVQSAYDWGQENCDGYTDAVDGAMESVPDILQELPKGDLEKYRCKFCFFPWPEWF